MEYIIAAKERCDFLWIGITRYDLTIKLEKTLAAHRQDAAANPLTYYERINLIDGALAEIGITRDQYGFIPFPIDEPQKLVQFLPSHVPCFTTVYDDWNRHKVDLLRSHGYEVVVLWERDYKEISGEEVRSFLEAHDQSWRKLVPSFVAKELSEPEIAERIRHPDVPSSAPRP